MGTSIKVAVCCLRNCDEAFLACTLALSRVRGYYTEQSFLTYHDESIFVASKGDIETVRIPRVASERSSLDGIRRAVVFIVLLFDPVILLILPRLLSLSRLRIPSQNQIFRGNEIGNNDARLAAIFFATARIYVSDYSSLSLLSSAN